MIISLSVEIYLREITYVEYTRIKNKVDCDFVIWTLLS